MATTAKRSNIPRRAVQDCPEFLSTNAMTVGHGERIDGPCAARCDVTVEGGKPLIDWHQTHTAPVVRTDCFANERHLISRAPHHLNDMIDASRAREVCLPTKGPKIEPDGCVIWQRCSRDFAASKKYWCARLDLQHNSIRPRHAGPNIDDIEDIFAGGAIVRSHGLRQQHAYPARAVDNRRRGIKPRSFGASQIANSICVPLHKLPHAPLRR